MLPTPASCAASETMTLTGVPVRVSSDPACAPNASGMSSCDGDHLRRIAISTTTGRRAATDAFTVTSAVTSATSTIITVRMRAREPPTRSTSWCPAQVVTPLASSPPLTTKSEAMNTTVGSPKPARACSRSRTPVPQSASATPTATAATGNRSHTKTATVTARTKNVIVESLISTTAECVPRRARQAPGRGSLQGSGDAEHHERRDRQRAHQRQHEANPSVVPDACERDAGHDHSARGGDEPRNAGAPAPARDDERTRHVGEVAERGEKRHREGRVPRGRWNAEGDPGVDEHHERREDRCVGAADGVLHPAEDRVDRLRVVEDHCHAAGEDDCDARADEVAEALGDVPGDLLLAVARDQADDDRRHEEERRELGEPPAEVPPRVVRNRLVRVRVDVLLQVEDRVPRDDREDEQGEAERRDPEHELLASGEHQ